MPRASAADRFERGLLAALQRLPALRGQRLIVAASGGADSTALLVALHALAGSGRYPCEPIACHIDHGLRPEAARRAEQRLLAESCAALGVPLIVRPVRVERRQGRGSLEAAARAARYAALGTVAAEEGASAVLTAHTAGDQVETVLLRLLRGTGVTGLASIAPRSRPWGAAGPLLVRPLLDVWPEATRYYCRARGVAWSEDETNASPRFARNRVRHELLPLLTALHPGADRALLRLAGQAAELRTWIDAEVERVLGACLARDGDAILLRRPPAALPPYLGRQVAARLLAELLGGAAAPGARQVEALYACWSGPLGRRCDLGRGWRAAATGEGLRIQRVPEPPSASRPVEDGAAGGSACWPLRVGLTEIPGWRVGLAPLASAEQPQADPALAAYLDGAVAGRLSLRFWRPGDRMRPAGLKGSKKLQDIFVDEKVDRARRCRVPLLLLDGECIWAVGVKRSPLAPAVPGPRSALCVWLSPANEG
jgi:tRNA(Ile)-lysidine synthase